MASVLSAAHAPAYQIDPSGDRRFWAVDKVILTYLAFAACLIAAGWSRMPEAGLLLAANAAGAALVVFEVKRPNPSTRVFRHWYPLPYVAACYKEMAILIPALRTGSADEWLANLDFRIWGNHPTVWLERISSPLLTEALQSLYTLFVPAVLLIAVLLWRDRRYAEFRYYAFLIALGFLVSYVGYLAVPARGPRFLLAHLQTVPLRGLWLFNGMQTMLDRLESAHYDCFPSGHTELTFLAWWGSKMISKALFRIYFLYTLSIIFATVYLRYHYSVDVFAGVVVAVLLIVIAPPAYRWLSQRG